MKYTFFFLIMCYSVVAQKVYFQYKNSETSENIFVSDGTILGELNGFDLNAEKGQENTFYQQLNVNPAKQIYIAKWLDSNIKFYQFIVFNDDTVTITNTKNGIFFKSKNANEYSFLNNLEEKKLGIFDLKEVNIYENPTFYESVRLQRMQELSEADSLFSFRENFKIYVKNFFNLSYLWGWLQIFDENSLINPNNIIDKEKYKESLLNNKSYILLDSLEIENIYYTSYPKTLINYNIGLTWSRTSTIPSLKQQLFESVKNFTGYHKNLLLSLIFEKLRQNNLVDNECSTFYFKECSNESFKKYFRHKLNMLTAKNEIKELNLLDSNHKELLLKEILGDLNYIYFWASWCGPCKLEDEYFSKLKSHFKNQNIEFIKISIDENFEDWIKFIEKLNKKKQNNFIIKNEGNLYKNGNILLYIDSVPRFLILDSLGNVIDFDAPRASSSEIIDILNKLLLKK